MSAILHAQPFEGSHSGENIHLKFDAMFESWTITRDQVHLVVSDNASNMAKAVRDADLPHLGCLAHTLQLVVKDGVLAQRAVIDLLAVARKIVGHFRHSQLACGRLKIIQSNLGLKQHKLVQDEPTRWNSSLYMLQRIIEQKTALAAYGAEHSLVQLTPNQIDLSNKIIAILSPVEELTQSVSADTAATSVVKPFVRLLSRLLTQHHDDRGVRTMKAEKNSSLTRRFADVEDDENLTISTMLDPRFKDNFFSTAAVKSKVKGLVQDKVKDLNSTVDVGSGAEKDPVSDEPPAKRPCTLWNTLSDILEESGATTVSDSDAIDEVDMYLREPVIKFGQDSPYTWWAQNKQRFTYLSQVARKFLSAPPTSVTSERLFSVAGDIYDEKRNRLTPEKAEMLLFIRQNFKLTGKLN